MIEDYKTTDAQDIKRRVGRPPNSERMPAAIPVEADLKQRVMPPIPRCPGCGKGTHPTTEKWATEKGRTVGYGNCRICGARLKYYSATETECAKIALVPKFCNA